MIRWHPLIIELQNTFHCTGMLNIDALHGINHLLTGEGPERAPNPCSEAVWQQPHLCKDDK